MVSYYRILYITVLISLGKKFERMKEIVENAKVLGENTSDRRYYKTQASTRITHTLSFSSTTMSNSMTEREKVFAFREIAWEENTWEPCDVTYCDWSHCSSSHLASMPRLCPPLKSFSRSPPGRDKIFQRPRLILNERENTRLIGRFVPYYNEPMYNDIRIGCNSQTATLHPWVEA